MKSRNALILLLAIVCVTTWWQIETRLSTARDLNRKLAMEAAYLVEVQGDKKHQPEFMATTPSWGHTVGDRIHFTTAPNPAPAETELDQPTPVQR